MELNPKQLKFCEEYIVDSNGTQAAIRAGYSARTAQEQSARLLSKVMVQEKVHELRVEQSKRVEVKADEVLTELLRLAQLDPRAIFDSEGNVLPPKLWPDEIAACVSSIGYDKLGRLKVSFWSKTQALDMLAKHKGLLVMKHELTGKDGGAIEISPAERKKKIKELGEAITITESEHEDPPGFEKLAND